jgi:hypothetical protein
MRETYQNILFAIIIIFLIALTALFFSQQKTIRELSTLLNGQTNTAEVAKANVAQIERNQNNSEATVNSISGKLISISGNVLTVEAEMTDWKKMKELRNSSIPAPTYKKTYTVTVDDKTQFSTNKLDSIKVGDTMSVASKELVYQTDKLTAVFIMSLVAK